MKTKPIELTDSLRHRFHSKYIPSEDGCWDWTAAVSSAGYGVIQAGGRTNSLLLAHRVAYSIHTGSIAEGRVIDHLCRNRRCVNPYHLEAVSFEENVRRGDTYSSGSPRRDKKHCPQGHPYSGDNLRMNSNGSRSCRTCIKANARRRYLESKSCL